MRRLTVLALVVIVLASLTFALSYTGSEEQPPCRPCEHSESEPSAVSVCDIAQPYNFMKTLLSLDGNFEVMPGQLSNRGVAVQFTNHATAEAEEELGQKG
jgi:hypothetical protein